jgi:hypothetical protein
MYVTGTVTGIRFKKNDAGFRELRYRDETRSMLEAVAHTMADSANSTLETNGPRDVKPGYMIFSQPGEAKPYGRWRVSVTAVSRHAIRHNAVHNTLVRVLNGGR